MPDADDEESAALQPFAARAEPSPEAAAATVATIPPAKVRSRFAAGLVLHERRLWVVALLALAAAFWWLNPTLVPKAPLTMHEVLAAAVKAYEIMGCLALMIFGLWSR